MSALVGGMRRSGSWVSGRLSNFWSGISAVGIKELRGRMRGRRAFVVLTIYLILLSVLAFAVYYFLKQQALINGTSVPGGVTIDPGGGFGGRPIPFPDGSSGVGSGGTALSATIGHSMFGALLAVETLLIMVLAPAFTSGAISLEREKQTLDLLITTPLSTLGMVLGKLISALSYVFLLIIASIPLASLVFVFGAVGPEDLVRGYLVLFALAFGMGALGMFISALTKRTQTATVLTYVLVLVLSVGTWAGHQFWLVAGKKTTSSSLVVTTKPFNAPEALLYLNPFVADADLVCTTAPGYDALCSYMSSVTGKPYFGTPTNTGTTFDTNGGKAIIPPGGADFAGPNGVVVMGDAFSAPAPAVACAPNMRCLDVTTGINAATTLSLGFPRDTFWPKSAAAFTLVGVLLTLLSAQLVAPTRRLRLRRPSFGSLRRRRNAPTTTDEEVVEETLGEPTMETSV